MPNKDQVRGSVFNDDRDNGVIIGYVCGDASFERTIFVDVIYKQTDGSKITHRFLLTDLIERLKNDPKTSRQD